LNGWMSRPKANKLEVIALKNAVSPSTAKIAATTWSDNAIGYMLCDSNDMQHAEQRTSLFSSVYRVGHDGGFYVTPENLEQAIVIFAARRLIRPTWLNDRDQFLQPTGPLSREFKHDCLMWMLFNRCNRTAGADGLDWNGKKWSLVNHFIPFTEAEVDAPDRFESDFMVQHLRGKTFSAEARAVLNSARVLWTKYFAYTDVRNLRDELKLNRADVGWFQVRTALAARNASGDTLPINFSAFETAYQALTEKLKPQVFSLGFLR
jgi:hypothetical protein